MTENEGRPYHHGDLRRILLDHAVDAINGSGVERLSLRELARRAGVSHAAPAHHFADRTGLLTAVAAQGFRRLGDDLGAVLAETGSFLEIGVGYVRFAVRNPAHFDVMFRPGLHHRDDPDLAAARDHANGVLRAGAATINAAGAGDSASAAKDPEAVGLAAWSLGHGLATLYHSGALGVSTEDELAELARRATRMLFF